MRAGGEGEVVDLWGPGFLGVMPCRVRLGMGMGGSVEPGDPSRVVLGPPRSAAPSLETRAPALAGPADKGGGCQICFLRLLPAPVTLESATNFPLCCASSSDHGFPPGSCPRSPRGEAAAEGRLWGAASRRRGCVWERGAGSPVSLPVPPHSTTRHGRHLHAVPRGQRGGRAPLAGQH